MEKALQIKRLSEKLLFKDRKDILRIHLYTKLLYKGLIPYENDLNVLITLYEMGGYNNGEEQSKFFKECIEKKYKRTVQSIRNTLSKYTDIGVLNRPKNEKRFLSDEWLPKVDADKLMLEYYISHN